MPIVSINLSREALYEYHCIPKGRRSSRISYLLVRNGTGAYIEAMDSESRELCPRCRGVISPPLQEGDRRIMNSGEECVWTAEGWKVIE